MSAFLYRMGRAAARGRFLVIGVWLVILFVAGGGTLLFNKGADDTFVIPGSEAQEALDYLSRVFPEIGLTPAQILVVAPPGERIDTTDGKAAVSAAAKRMGKVGQVATAVDPFGEMARGTVSKDHRAALIVVQLGVPLSDVSPDTKAAIKTISDDLRTDLGLDAEVYTGGDAFSERIPKLSPIEGIGLVIALVVLLIVFGSFIAAGIPLLTAVFGVGISVALIYAATAIAPVSSTAPMLAVMLGLAVGIDYALFLLSRHRDQLAWGLDVEESIARATATAGSAVIFAGLTVVIALLGLAVVGIPFLTTMGVAAAAAVTIAVLIAITLIPALLSLAGTRLRPKDRRPRPAKPDRPPRRRIGVATRWVRLATKVPALTIAIVVVGLAVCTIPALELRLALPDNGTEEHGALARDTFDAVTEHFGPGYNGPLIVTVDVLAINDPLGVTDKIADEIRDLPGVAGVPLATPNPKGDTSVIQVVPKTPPDSPGTDRLVTALRDRAAHWEDTYGTKTAVTGITAAGIDLSDKLGNALLPFGVLVVGFSLILLAMVFRSIWVPIKATAGYLLSVGAAFGATSFVFQQGHFADALNVVHVGSVISFLPIILMGVLFGLAMDYEVFLVSRIREHYVHNGDPDEAIESGFVSAFKVVVAAAVIMLGVFAAFVPEGSVAIKPIGFSLAVGVFVDAFIVRMTLVPAVLALLGHRAWGLPGAIDRALPIFDAEGDSLMHELRLADWPGTGADEAISARDVRLHDDRGRTVFADVNLHLPTGAILAIHGHGKHASGKSALLYTLGGRVNRFAGDLKVLGQVLPQHTHAVRGRVAIIACRDVADPAAEVQAALADEAGLILFDDIDTVVHAGPRNALRDLLAHRVTPSGRPITVVFTCQDPALVADLLPSAEIHTLAVAPQPAEVL